MKAPIELRIQNLYEDGCEVITTPSAEVTVPASGVDLDQWADDELFELTGTGKTEGDSWYFVEIIKFDARPDLVGREFEFGL